MLGFGKKSLNANSIFGKIDGKEFTFKEISKHFTGQFVDYFNESYPILEANLASAKIEIDKVHDSEFYAILLPAALAVSLVPVRNLWGEEAFAVVRDATIERMAQLSENSDLRAELDRDLKQYDEVWKNGLKEKDIHNVAAFALSRLANPPTIQSPIDGKILHPLTLMATSDTIIKLMGTFWADLKKSIG